MRRRELLAATVAAALASGCNFILNIEHDYEVGARQATGGAGGAEPTSTSSSTSASVASSSGSTSSSASTTSSSASTSSSSASNTSSSASTSSSSASTSSSSGGAPACPDAAMIDVGTFCVDATEVTNAAYAAWLSKAPSVAAQPSFCAWNTDFTPSSGWPPGAGKATEPVVNVDWCDAFAYCASAGKRLCGRIGGGAVDYAAGFKDPAQSEWMAACSNAGATSYPYGSTYVSGACNGRDYTHPNQTVAVASAVVCHGAAVPYVAIFDLSGNVAEWEDACNGANGAGDLCHRRGGSFKDNSAALRCDADDGGLARSSADAGTGFRCCGG